jgi:polysaccharide pyruvyl transferase WcaK-like protein
MTSTPEHKSYVALLGAYERDNFGDILFLKVCMKLLYPWPVVPLSVLSRNMHAEGAGTIVSASAWFDCCEDSFLPKALIVAGGEVLNCPVSVALKYDIDKVRSQSFSNSSHAYKQRLGELLSWRAGKLAYVPDLTKLLGEKEHMVDFALNSVGGSNLEPGSPSLIESLKTVQQTKYTSVRDTVTHTLLCEEDLGQSSVELNPDIVSTVQTCCALEVEEAFTKAVSLNPWLTEPYLLFQCKDNFIKNNGLELVAKAIATTAQSLNLSVVFQPAGIASGHDSFEMLDELGQLAQKHAGGGLRIHTQYDRDVWTQVGVIANAACFVGTSLHGRIVATAYATPRVGLENEKVNIYAATWERDDFQPFNVPINNLQESVKKAMTVSPTRLVEFASNQSAKALTGFAQLRKTMNLFDFDEDTKATKEKIQLVSEIALLRETEMLREAVLDLVYELSKERKIRSSIENKLTEILGAPSWRLTKPVRALDWLLAKAKN